MTLRRLAKLVVLPPRQHLFLAEAVVYLARARIDFGRRPAKDILAALQSQSDLTAPRIAIDIATLSWAIKAAAGGVPWRSDCLIQSMAADRWLRRHGVIAEFRLGVRPSADGALIAHAWLELDGTVLTGGDDVSHYELLIVGRSDAS